MRSKIVNRTRYISASDPMPSRKLEYTYYLSIAYSVLGPAIGLDIPLLAGGLILVLSTWCFLQIQSTIKAAYGPIALLLACGFTVLLIQIVFHGASVLDESPRNFIIGFLGLIIVRSLCLRPGFLHRFTVVLFVLGLITLPYLTFSPGAVEQARVGAAVQGGLSHPAGLAGWFGFCAVYFAILGVKTNRTTVRTAAWLVTVGCIFVIGLTVERGPLFGVALAITLGSRSILRRGFVPLLILISLAGLVYQTGIFDRAATFYEQRGMEETGRELIWPAVIERIVTSPLVGVGAANVLTAPGGRFESRLVASHNTFLEFALTSGVPVSAVYIAFWIQTVWRCLWQTKRSEYAPFQLPFLAFMFVTSMLGDLNMSPWAILAFSVGADTGTSNAKQRFRVMNAARRRIRAQALRRGTDTVNRMARYQSLQK